MPFTLTSLPYAEDALEPHISSKTLAIHHGRHHHKYVETLNELIVRTPHERRSLTAIVLATHGDKGPGAAKIFNNAAQVWNHDFFWSCMRPQGGGAPKGPLAERVEQAFGSYDKFKDTFKSAAADRFGSGYIWLVVDDGNLRVRSTPDAVNPLVEGHSAILVCDVWEHSYYLDYQDRRADYVEAFLKHLVNWDFALDRLSDAPAEAPLKRTAIG